MRYFYEQLQKAGIEWLSMKNKLANKREDLMRDLVERRSADFALLVYQLEKKFKRSPLRLWQSAGVKRSEAEKWAEGEMQRREQELRNAEAEDAKYEL